MFTHLPSGPFPSGFPVKILHANLFSTICDTYTTPSLVQLPQGYLVKDYTSHETTYCVIFPILLLSYKCLVVCFLLGNFPAPEFYMPTFWNILSAY